MTPRVVRTVEDKFSDAVNERVNRAQKAIVAKFESEGSAWMSDNSGDHLAWVAAEAIRGMLAPLSVTAEQVETQLVREWHEDQCACRDFDGVDIETCYTRKTSKYGFYPPTSWGVDAVFTAMGIPVVDGE